MSSPSTLDNNDHCEVLFDQEVDIDQQLAKKFEKESAEGKVINLE